MRMTHALMGGASLAVLTLAVLTTAHLQNVPLRLPDATPPADISLLPRQETPADETETRARVDANQQAQPAQPVIDAAKVEVQTAQSGTDADGEADMPVIDGTISLQLLAEGVGNPDDLFARFFIFSA